jgi:hypothetical protein
MSGNNAGLPGLGKNPGLPGLGNNPGLPGLGNNPGLPLRLRNNIAEGARDMRKKQINRMKKNNNTKTQKKMNLVRDKKQETMTKLDEYHTYCRDLTVAYDKKHGEVESATIIINNIREQLDEGTDDLLRHIRAAEGLNNNYNRIGQNDTNEILAILNEIIGKVPGNLTASVSKLERYKAQQLIMERERRTNDEQIQIRLQSIRDRVNAIKNVKGLPKKDGSNNYVEPVEGIVNKIVMAERRPTKRNKRSKSASYSSPRAMRAHGSLQNARNIAKKTAQNRRRLKGKYERKQFAAAPGQGYSKRRKKMTSKNQLRNKTPPKLAPQPLRDFPSSEKSSISELNGNNINSFGTQGDNNEWGGKASSPWAAGPKKSANKKTPQGVNSNDPFQMNNFKL